MILFYFDYVLVLRDIRHRFVACVCQVLFKLHKSKVVNFAKIWVKLGKIWRKIEKLQFQIAGYSEEVWKTGLRQKKVRPVGYQKWTFRIFRFSHSFTPKIDVKVCHIYIYFFFSKKCNISLFCDVISRAPYTSGIWYSQVS